MVKFFLKRLLQAFVVMLVISVIAFSVRSALGDPVRQLAGMNVTWAQRQAIRTKLGLDKPILFQYSHFLRNALRGDLGMSYFYKRPVVEVILQKMPATLELVFAAVLLVILLSVPLGVYSAIYSRSIISRIIMGGSIVGLSIPVFLTAILLMWIFSIHLGWLPSFGRGKIVHVFGYWDTNYLTKDGLLHLILPVLSLSSQVLPLFIRLIRADMLEVLTTEYVRFAIAKGLKRRSVYFRHALKNTLLPVVTVGGLQVGTLIAYTVLTESVFQWPGMGFMFLEATKRADIPLITGYLLFVGLIFVIINTIVDVLYGLLNPKIRLMEGGE